MADIVKRLRDLLLSDPGLRLEAADEIERLRGLEKTKDWLLKDMGKDISRLQLEIERLREVLRDKRSELERLREVLIHMGYDGVD